MAKTDLSQLCVLLTLGFNLGLVQSSFFNVDVVYEVTLDVFSGRNDPHWKIDKTHPQYNAVAQAVNNGPPTDMDRHLGYAGFTVNARNAFGQTAWKTVGRHTNRRLESLLLDSCPSLNRQGAGGEGGDDDISEAVINHVRAGIYGQLPVAVKEVKAEYDDGSISEITVKHTVFGRHKRQARGQCSTVFTPSNWNYAPVQRNNNCYNYASNLQTNTFAQPGRASGRRFRFNERNEVYNACLRDGFVGLGFTPNAGSNCLIALVIWPGEDYHFYRLDADGTWSHKSGQTRARNTDESGRRIRNPRQADTGPYRIFGGYLGVTPNVNII